MTKTGEVRWRDEDGRLWLAESYVDHDGNVHTEQTEIVEG